MSRRGVKLARKTTLLLLLVVAARPLGAADEFDLLDINEGELRFLTEAPTTPPHLQSGHIQIHKSSLRDGWITVKQCHHNLATVSAMQIVFPRNRVRQLEILQSNNIDRAWVEGPTIQLAGVRKDASVCILSENRALRRSSLDGTYEWHGGPYMRRFLDGYFPMHIKLAIDYPTTQLRLTSLEPSALRLKSVTQPGYVRIDAMFEGRLDIVLRFNASDIPPGIGWQ